MGDHHFTLQVLTGSSEKRTAPTRIGLKALNDDIALARAMLADTGMTTAREDLALEAAFWAQLPGSFLLPAAQGADHLAQLLRQGALSQLSLRPRDRQSLGRCARAPHHQRPLAVLLLAPCERPAATRTAAAARIPATPSFAGRPARASPCSSAFWWHARPPGRHPSHLRQGPRLEILVRALGRHLSAPQERRADRLQPAAAPANRPPMSNS